MASVSTVFLDRDGVVNRKRPAGSYVTRWDEFAFLPNVGEALSLLRRAGLRVIIVTNQRGIARGFMTESELDLIHDRMRAQLADLGASVDGVYACPHEEGRCRCRKPLTGLFLQAQRAFPQIDFTRAAMVGDSLSDMQAGAALGCRTYLVATEPDAGRIVADARERKVAIDAVAASLYDVVVQHLLPGGLVAIGR